MDPEPDLDRVTRFETALKAWGGRPPRTPAPFAAHRLAARLAEKRDRPPRRPLALARLAPFAGIAAVVLATGFGAWIALPVAPPPMPAPAPPAAGIAGMAPVDDGVVVLWLDRETPLYLTLSPPRAEKGGPS